MKGIEIISLWEAAKKSVVNAHAHPGGELGPYIRSRYYITYNGCSVCDFMEKKLAIFYTADCCERPWSIGRWIRLGDNSVMVDNIDPQKDYDVYAYKSVAERFEDGTYRPKKFLVYKEGSRWIDGKHTFDTFEQADAYARRMAQEEIDLLRRDSTYRQHTASSVYNDAQRACERDELRHYEYYNYSGYRYWFSVNGVD